MEPRPPQKKVNVFSINLSFKMWYFVSYTPLNIRRILVNVFINQAITPHKSVWNKTAGTVCSCMYLCVYTYTYIYTYRAHIDVHSIWSTNIDIQVTTPHKTMCRFLRSKYPIEIYNIYYT